MTPEQVKVDAFNKAWNNICEGACENHVGECKVVLVEGWGYWSYCDTAIAEDKSRNLTVTIQNVVQMSRVDDSRTPEQKAKQEMSMTWEDCER